MVRLQTGTVRERERRTSTTENPKKTLKENTETNREGPTPNYSFLLQQQQQQEQEQQEKEQEQECFNTTRLALPVDVVIDDRDKKESFWRGLFSGKSESKTRNRLKKKKELQLQYIERKKVVNERAKHRRLAGRRISSISGSLLTPEQIEDDKYLTKLTRKTNNPHKDHTSWIQRQSTHELEEAIYRAQHHHFFGLRKMWKRFIQSQCSVVSDKEDDPPAAHISQLLVKIASRNKRRKNCEHELEIARMIMRTTNRIAIATSHKFKLSPLHVACIQGLPPDVISLLMEQELPQHQQHLNQSIVHVRTDTGAISLHCIVQCICDGGIPYSEGVEIIDLLCNKDISTIHSVNNDMDSPLDLAHMVMVRKEEMKRKPSEMNTLSLETQIQMIRVLLMHLRRISTNAYRSHKRQCEKDRYETKKRLDEQRYDSNEEVSEGSISKGVFLRSSQFSKGSTFSETHCASVDSNIRQGVNQYFSLDVFKDCPVLEDESLKEPFIRGGLKMQFS